MTIGIKYVALVDKVSLFLDKLYPLVKDPNPTVQKILAEIGNNELVEAVGWEPPDQSREDHTNRAGTEAVAEENRKEEIDMIPQTDIQLLNRVEKRLLGHLLRSANDYQAIFNLLYWIDTRRARIK